MILFFIVLLILAGLARLVWSSDIRSGISFVLDRGGLWVRYSTSLGPLIFSGYQFRLMSGHKPRAWKRNVLTGKLKQITLGAALGTIFRKKWEPIQIPLRGAFDIGINLEIQRLDVQAKLGIEDDAAATALLCGCLTAVLHAVRAVSTRGKTVPGGVIRIRPVFNRARLSVRLKCILAIKASHIIREVIEGFAGRKRDGNTPNRKHYADDNGKSA